MNGVTAQLGSRFRVLGSDVGFTKHGPDLQEAALGAGANPADPNFGEEPEPTGAQQSLSGELRTIPTKPGRYADFYTELAEALRTNTPPPVNSTDAIRTIELIEQLR
jgi:hypothetical protein